jgi:hypothetical protein
MRLKSLLIPILLLLFVSACGSDDAPTATEPAQAETLVPVVEDTPAPVAGQTTQTPPPETGEEPSPTAVTTGAEEESSPTPIAAGATATFSPASLNGFLLQDAGFQTPESVVHDAEADVYLVSNINGSPSAEDGNGFISQVSPEGEIIALKWIDGEADGVTLNAPKGMALTETELWVTDITVVRIFDRNSGAPLGEVPVEGASFLNDAAAGPDGDIWISDSNNETLHRIAPDHSVEQVAEVTNINGIAIVDGEVLVTSSQSIVAVQMDGSSSEVAPVPSSGLDGLVSIGGGALAVSSWNGSNVYVIASGDSFEIIGDISGPADIGFDGLRSLILIPHFRDDALQAVPLS